MSLDAAPPAPFTRADVAHVRQELARLEEVWRGGDPVSVLLGDVRGIVLGCDAAGDGVAHAAGAALRQRRPFAMLRLGDGEGNVLGCCDPALDPMRELTWFDVVFRQQAGTGLGVAEARDFAARMERAAIAADVLGIRGIMPWAHLSAVYPTIGGYVRNCLEGGRIRAALGHLRAQDQVERWARSGALRASLLTHAWVYVPLLDHLGDLVAQAGRVIVVSGRTEVFAPFVARHGGGVPIDCIAVPPEPSLKPGGTGHHPAVFEAVCRRLEGDLRGCLVLVGAGIFGKIYCHVARQSGAVALDLGSGFDILAGHASRPVHRFFGDVVARHRLV